MTTTKKVAKATFFLTFFFAIYFVGKIVFKGMDSLLDLVMPAISLTSGLVWGFSSESKEVKVGS